MKKCDTKFCKHKTKGKYCGTCRSRQSRAKNPERYAYNNLKSNAKRRKKYFDLTLPEFNEFCVPTKYMVGKGRTKNSLSIDCKINEVGYTKDNIRAITVSLNSRKGTKVLDYDYVTGTARVLDCRIEHDPLSPF